MIFFDFGARLSRLYRRVFRRSEDHRNELLRFPFYPAKVRKRERGCLIKLLSSILHGPAFNLSR